jgi:Tol biopolymer transport system component
LLAYVSACVQDASSAIDARHARPRSVTESVAYAAGDSNVITRRLWVAGIVDDVADVSEDGKTVLVDSAGTLWLRDITTGASRPVVASDSGWVVTARLSRDGARVYYGRAVPRPTWDTLELRVKDVGTSRDRLVQRFDGARAYIEFGDETRDGAGLFVALRARDWTWKLARISLGDGTVTSLKSFKWRSPGAPRLSPDGRFVAYDVSPNERSNKRDVYVLATDGSHEVQITRARENERVVGWTGDGTGLLITRDQGGSRDLVRIPMRRGERVGEERLVRSDVVSMRAVRVTTDRLYYLITNRPRELVSAPLTGATGPGTPTPATMLRTLDYTAYAVSPDGARLAYFVAGENDGNGPISLFVRSLASGDERELELPVDYIWALQWTTRPQELVAVAQKRGRDEHYRIDLRTASAEPVPGGLAPCGGEAISILPLVLPNGEATYYLRRAGRGPVAELVACPPERGAGRVLLQGELLPAAYALSPDGRRIVVLEHRKDSTVVHLFPTSSGSNESPRRFAVVGRFMGIAGWPADGGGPLLARAREAAGSELWRLAIPGDGRLTLAFRTDQGRAPRYVAPLDRVLYTLPHARPDELWVVERVAVGTPANGGRR